MRNDLHFSSKNQKWETNPGIIKDLATVFPWDRDLFASRPNVCKNFWTEEDDALTKEWNEGLNYANPQYGDLKKGRILPYAAEMQRKYQNAIVMLLSAKPGTRWFQDGAAMATGTIFIQGRIRFGSDEYWIGKLNELIQEGDVDAIKRIVPAKLGGNHANLFTLSSVALLYKQIFARKSDKSLEDTRKRYEQWRQSDRLKPDPAAFDSAFMVFGWENLSAPQQEKLRSYGLFATFK